MWALKVRLAETAGFCFGVERAVGMALRIAAEPGRGAVYTLGSIIHNEEVVADLERQGVLAVSLKELKNLKEGTVILCSHGVSRSVIEEVACLKDENGQKKFQVEDATCPFVKKIHRIVEEKSGQGYRILVIGDRNHPEVEGIIGWSKTPVIVTDNEKDLQNLEIKEGEKLCVVAQTTFNYDMQRDGRTSGRSCEACQAIGCHDCDRREAELEHREAFRNFKKGM